MALDSRFIQGFTRRGLNAQGSAVNTRGIKKPPVAQPPGIQPPEPYGKTQLNNQPLYMMPLGWQGPPMGPKSQTPDLDQALAKAAAARQMGESVLARTGGPVAPQMPFPRGAFSGGPNPFTSGGLMPGGTGEIPEGAAKFNPMSVFQRPRQDGVDPDMKAMIDAMTGARVHKGLSGRQLGMEDVDPNLKYMLYAMRGRRHKGMRGEDIY